MRCKISATSEASATNKNLANKYLQFSFFCSSLTKKNVIKIDKRDIFFLFRRSRPEVFYKKMSLEISQNSQESTCGRVSILIKLQAGFQLYLKNGSGTGVFLCILRNF